LINPAGRRYPYFTLLRNSAVLPPVDIGEEDLAVLLYTSGTQGTPRVYGQPLLLREPGDIEAELFNLTAKDRVFTAQPFYYMDPQWNTLMVMTRNAT